MCVSPAFGVCVFCLVLFRQTIPSQTIAEGRIIPSDKKSSTLPDQEETTQAENLKRTVVYRDYRSERKAVLTEKRNWFVLKLFEKYGTGETLSFGGFEHMLSHIRLQNIYFPGRNMTFDILNRLITFVSKHENQTHFPEASVDNKYKRDVYVNDTKHYNTTLVEIYDTINHYSNVAHISKDDTKTDDLDKRISDGIFLRHLETAPIPEAHLQRNRSPINHTEHFNHPSQAVHTLNHGGINTTSLKETTHSLINRSTQVYDYKMEINEHITREDSDMNAHDTVDDGESSHGHEEDMSKQIDYKLSEIPAKVWRSSCIAVVIVSVIGLLSVVVISIANMMLYNHLLNFLVSLAVGALSGDALLHLLPHALQIATDDEMMNGHDVGGVFKGLCCLGSIYLFFLLESVLTLLTDCNRKRKKRKRQRLSREDTFGGQELPYAFQELSFVADKKSPKSSHQQIYPEINKEETAIMLNKSEFSRSHSHSHSHHGDQVPSSVAAIAWMVILGDGMHNLSDGLAIGVAFGAGISSGFSTSIAVLCHELPHEIGDFAMLLKSGMSVKQAIFYNVVSSIFSFIGMVIGVMLGNVTSASLWIFAVVAGMFLYIALVDMLPEIRNRAHEGMVRKQLCDLLLQSAGMFVGAGIMLSIALYEDKIQIAFDPL
ncbi:hypothetical protein ACJMK2_022286 [Sinanodonta woodiana]|uniref:Zinc transporter foi n=1 Tax=Sinanodonta woodiana TaxID=1069815 RepID=A0ABD3TIK7_SINWO